MGKFGGGVDLDVTLSYWSGIQTSMREITEKTLHPLVPDVFITAIQAQLRQYGGTRLAEPRPCPHCDSRQHRKNGYQDRTFARLIIDEGFERVTVNVQLYECTNCGSRFQGDVSELFYEDCHYAKPIVDLCLFHAAENPFNASERILQNQTVSKSIGTRSNATPSGSATQSPTATVSRSPALLCR